MYAQVAARSTMCAQPAPRERLGVAYHLVRVEDELCRRSGVELRVPARSLFERYYLGVDRFSDLDTIVKNRIH